MAIIEKGKKGFQSISDHKKKDKKGVYYLTQLEMDLLKQYCIENKTKPSLLIRDLLGDRIGFKRD
jgi:hypothetical protein